jgi:hypothetical protein
MFPDLKMEITAAVALVGANERIATISIANAAAFRWFAVKSHP